MHLTCHYQRYVKRFQWKAAFFASFPICEWFYCFFRDSPSVRGFVSRSHDGGCHLKADLPWVGFVSRRGVVLGTDVFDATWREGEVLEVKCRTNHSSQILGKPPPPTQYYLLRMRRVFTSSDHSLWRTSLIKSRTYPRCNTLARWSLLIAVIGSEILHSKSCFIGPNHLGRAPKNYFPIWLFLFLYSSHHQGLRRS